MASEEIFRDPFSPPRLFRNPHLQSILPTLSWRRFTVRSRARALLSASREHILECGDGVRLLGLHSAHDSKHSRPLVILLHGWEGSADSFYVLSLGSYLFARGYDIFRLNFRDHGPTHHLNRDLFHSCRIVEVVGAVRAIQEKFAPPSLNIAGFSLGGNFALRTASRAERAGIRLNKAIGICPVLSPRNTLAALKSGWFVYEQYFVHKWKDSLRIKQRAFPGHFDFKEIYGLDNLHDMTDVLVRNHTEFPTLEDYLEGYAITGDGLANLNVEAHLLLAADDPIIPVNDVAQLARAPSLRIEVIPFGGHCGFFETFHRESWADRRVAAILEQR